MRDAFPIIYNRIPPLCCLVGGEISGVCGNLRLYLIVLSILTILLFLVCGGTEDRLGPGPERDRLKPTVLSGIHVVQIIEPWNVSFTAITLTCLRSRELPSKRAEVPSTHAETPKQHQGAQIR